jgi:hypothetical protein
MLMDVARRGKEGLGLSYLFGRVRATAELSESGWRPRTRKACCDAPVFGFVWPVYH